MAGWALPIQPFKPEEPPDMEQITIAGKVFTAPLRYREGHELTAPEANALNQAYHENLRGNFTKRVKEALSNGGFNQDALQAEFAAYAERYQFGVRSGGRQRDPLQQEALAIAKSMVNAGLKRHGINPNTVASAAKVAKARQLIQERPDILDLARRRLEEARVAASIDISSLVPEAAE